MRLKKIYYVIASISLLAQASAHQISNTVSPIFSIVPYTLLGVDDPGEQIALYYTVTNNSSISQRYLAFTYPGTPLDNVSNSCTDYETLAPDASCTLGFSVTVPSTRGQTLTIGQRNTPYEVKVCGYHGTGNDCSVPNQSDELTHIYNDAIIRLITSERDASTRLGYRTAAHSILSIGSNPSSSAVVSLPDSGVRGYISGLAKAGYEASIYGAGISIFPLDNTLIAKPYLISSTNQGTSWSVTSDLPLTEGYDSAHLYHGVSNSATEQTDIVGIQWVNTRHTVTTFAPLILTKLNNQWSASKPNLSDGFDEGALYSIDYRDGHWLAAGKQFGQHTRPYLLSSTDGVTWSIVTADALDEPAVFKNVKLGENSWIAAGYTVNSHEHYGFPFFVVSRDHGSSWNQVIVSSINRGMINQIDDANGTWIAVGQSADEDNRHGAPLILRSDDEGSTWTQESIEDLPGHWGGLLYKIKKIGHYWVAVGLQRTGATKHAYVPLIGLSDDDGLHWYSSTVPLTTGNNSGSTLSVIDGS